MDNEQRHRGPAATGFLADVAELAGLSTLRELAEVLGESYGTVRAWQSRGVLPAHGRRKVDALLIRCDEAQS